MQALLREPRQDIKRRAKAVSYAVAIPRMVNHIRFRNSRDVCFVWVPKTAGTSVYKWLNRELGMLKAKELPIVRAKFPQRGPVTFGHMDYRQLRRMGLVGDRFHRAALRFAFVRNPFDRAASLYYYFVRVERFHGSFDEFVTGMEAGMKPIGLFNYKAMSQCNPQADWLFDDTGSLVVHHLFRMENFNADAAKLATMLGVRPAVEHVNSTARSMTLPELFDGHDLQARVAHLYQRDFDLLDYDTAVLP